MKLAVVLLLSSALLSPAVFGQANGKLQIHFMHVGQGDGALLISPQGQTVLFDNGVRNYCHYVLGYLEQLGVSQIDYHVASHYHDDHIGCTVAVLQEYPLKMAAFDRGGAYKKNTETFRDYTNKVATLRRRAMQHEAVVLDADSPHPVRLEFAAMNGDGITTDNENDLSLVTVVRFGKFDAVFGGDLSGLVGNGYKDIETTVAPKVGQVEVYKVNHHGSRYSTNPDWIQTIKPKIGVISCGYQNKHKHPTDDCLERLHAAGVVTYWTSEGNGVSPVTSKDKVGGDIIVEIAPAAETFTVTYNDDKVDSYTVWNPAAANAEGYVWSSKAKYYHYPNCRYVESISPQNHTSGATPPAGKTLHLGCPK